MKIPRVLALWAAVGLIQSASAAVFISVGQSGANTNVNSTTSLTWNFTWNGSTDYVFDSAQFEINPDQGINSSSQLLVTIYSGFGGNAPGNSVLNLGGQQAVSAVTAAQVSALGAGFQTVNFIFPGSGLIQAGNYSVQLTSTADTSKDFNVKLGALTLYDGSKAAPLGSSLYSTDGNTTGTSTTAVPEPGSLGLVMFGLLGLGIRRRK